jgi:hypothetical protein
MRRVAEGAEFIDDAVAHAPAVLRAAVERLLPQPPAFYEVLAQPERLPRGNARLRRANDCGFNSVVVERHRARDAVVVLTNADKNRAETLANRIAPLVFR